ncbi:MAG: hypothetical protein NTY77_18575 [Elusimicrobia bacterium]|nr:hypothetical protein [Elusimicrobiota bacterium]
MKKILLYGAGTCAAVAVIAAVVMYLKLGAIVKAAVETWGPKATRTEVRLASVSLSPFSGSGRIKGLFIGNPAGFKTPGAFRMDSVRLTVDLKSLRGDHVKVKEIVVESPEVTFEGSLSGSNLSRIQKNVESFAPGLKVEIGLFKVTDGKVNLSLTALGSKSLTVPLSDIELRDIGRKSGGATVGEAAKVMFGAFTAAALRAAGGATGLVKGLFGKKK